MTASNTPAFTHDMAVTWGANHNQNGKGRRSGVAGRYGVGNNCENASKPQNKKKKVTIKFVARACVCVCLSSLEMRRRSTLWTLTKPLT